MRPTHLAAKVATTAPGTCATAPRNPIPGCVSCPPPAANPATEADLAREPELAVEICETSTEIDFGPKLALYQQSNVREYITVETLLPRIVWRVLRDGSYQVLPPDASGTYRSSVFPGLWLDESAYWRDDGVRLLEVLNAGLAAPEHQSFVESLKVTTT
jgi:hypothetical protein